MQPSTLIFFSTGEISIPLFKKLLADDRFKILALVCQPDRSAGRDMAVQVHPIKKLALAQGVPVFQPEKLSKDLELLESFKKNPPDFLLTFSYGQILSEAWLNLPKVAPLNVHPSLLPKYRGPTPLQSALLHGDVETGVTLMKMSKGMDEGAIAAQYELPIAATMHADTLFEAAAELAAEKIPEGILEILKKGEAAFTPQEEALVSFCSLIEREDGRVNFKESAEQIYNRFRAYSPWPGLFTTFKGKRLKLLKVETSSQPLESAEIRCEKDFILLGTSKGSLKVMELQLEGKKVLDAVTFMRGSPDFCSGMRVGE